MSLPRKTRLDAQITQGEVFDFDVYLYTDEEGTTPETLTGSTCIAQMRDRPGGTLLLSATCTLQAATGPWRVKYSGGTGAGSTGALTADAVHDVFVTLPNGDPVCAVDGRIKLLLRVSTP